MKREKLFRKVLFEGEEHPGINIVCDTLHEGLRAEFRDYHNKRKRNAVLMNCDGSAYINFDKNPVEVYSPYIPYGVAIFMDFEENSMNCQEYDEIIYVQPFPFALDSVNRKLDDIDTVFCNHSGKTYKIMFYRDRNQHSGEGDLVRIDQALEEAPERIRRKMGNTMAAKSMEFCVYRTPLDFVSILHGGCGNLGMSLLSCIEKFKSFRNKIEDFKGEWGEYRFILEEYDDLVDEVKINSLTRFNRVKGCANILEKYVRNYMDEFNGDIMRFVEEAYYESVKDICFWDLDRDIQNLKNGVEKYIEQELRSLAVCKEKCPETEAEYNNLIRVKYKLDTNFEKKVKLLINNGLMNYMYDYLKRKEELLSRSFLSDLDRNTL